jgi:hypothetical protein
MMIYQLISPHIHMFSDVVTYLHKHHGLNISAPDLCFRISIDGRVFCKVQIQVPIRVNHCFLGIIRKLFYRNLACIVQGGNSVIIGLVPWYKDSEQSRLSVFKASQVITLGIIANTKALQDFEAMQAPDEDVDGEASSGSDDQEMPNAPPPTQAAVAGPHALIPAAAAAAAGAASAAPAIKGKGKGKLGSDKGRVAISANFKEHEQFHTDSHKDANDWSKASVESFENLRVCHMVCFSSRVYVLIARDVCCKFEFQTVKFYKFCFLMAFPPRRMPPFR